MSADELLAVDMETVDAIRGVHVTCPGCGSPWAATAYSGERLLGNGLGDAGRGATWSAALGDLQEKHLARLERVLKAQEAHATARGALWGWLVGAGVALAGALAVWVALRW